MGLTGASGAVLPDSSLSVAHEDFLGMGTVWACRWVRLTERKLSAFPLVNAKGRFFGLSTGSAGARAGQLVWVEYLHVHVDAV